MVRVAVNGNPAHPMEVRMLRKRSAGIALMGICALLASVLNASFPAPATAAPIVPVTVTITRFIEVDNPDGGTAGFGDYFARVRINGFAPQQSPTVDPPGGGIIGQYEIQPFFRFTRNVDAALGNTIPIVIEMVDEDGFLGGPEDPMDINPLPGVRALTLLLNLTTGNWAGDVPLNRTSSLGAGDSDRGRVFFDISTRSTTGDADGDSLLDNWEIRGYDADGNGSVDVNLPAFGARPDHKDLFLELDTVAGQAPRRADIQAMKAAFAAAPITAGQAASVLIGGGGARGVNAPPNPDGQRGITLHVDTGNVVDPTAQEGAPTGTCADGIDNGGDGTADAVDTDCANNTSPVALPFRFLDAEVEDPAAPNCLDGLDNDGDGQADGTDADCLVGENLGGGQQIAPPNACNLDANFYRTKNEPGRNFDLAARQLIFRYGISAALPATCPSSGGWGELGGNDFIEFVHDAGTLMHEFGHTLNLNHGGNVDANCKPNYVSVMNYDNQFGVRRNGGGAIADYSAPRRALDGSTRGVAPIAQLRENALTEPTVLDPTDANNQFTFVNSLGLKVRNPLNSAPSWNGDVDPPFETGPAAINIDAAVPAGPTGQPAGCINTVTNSVLNGFDDWSAISLPFRQFGGLAGRGSLIETRPPMTLQQGIQLLTAVNTTDVRIEISDAPDPVQAGGRLTYTIRVTNRGPNPASNTRVVQQLPGGVSFAGASVGCLVPGLIVICNLGELLSGAVRTFTVTVDVPSSATATLTTTARVDHLAGPDPIAANNTVTATTAVTNPCTIAGTNGNDVLNGTAGPDVICGFAGDDVIAGLGGDDRILGGDGRDTINGGAGNNVIHGDAGDDIIDGGAGDDQIFGDEGNDTINGSLGNNTTDGGGGTDTCAGGGTKVNCELIGP